MAFEHVQLAAIPLVSVPGGTTEVRDARSGSSREELQLVPLINLRWGR